MLDRLTSGESPISRLSEEQVYRQEPLCLTAWVLAITRRPHTYMEVLCLLRRHLPKPCAVSVVIIPAVPPVPMLFSLSLLGIFFFL